MNNRERIKFKEGMIPITRDLHRYSLPVDKMYGLYEEINRIMDSIIPTAKDSQRVIKRLRELKRISTPFGNEIEKEKYSIL